MERPFHILTAQSFDREFVNSVISDTRWIKSQFTGNQWKGGINDPSSLSHLLEGKTMMLLFDQPSLRTYALFASAMLALGGKCEGWQNASRDSSLAKGETLEETGLILSMCPTVSVIVIRHPEAGAPEKVSRQAAVPVINAGDGLEHPTQALKDLFTIDEEFGHIDGLHIVVAGDLQGRTVRSLLYSLSLYRTRISLVSLPQLRLPDDLKYVLKSCAVPFEEDERELAEVVKTADIVYAMRPQIENWFPKERELDPTILSPLFPSDRLRDYYARCTIDAKVMANLPTHARILHPLPHRAELDAALDPENDHRLAYFRQARNGGPLGIALLARIHLRPSWRMGRRKLS